MAARFDEGAFLVAAFVAPAAAFFVGTVFLADGAFLAPAFFATFFSGGLSHDSPYTFRWQDFLHCRPSLQRRRRLTRVAHPHQYAAAY